MMQVVWAREIFDFAQTMKNRESYATGIGANGEIIVLSRALQAQETGAKRHRLHCVRYGFEQVFDLPPTQRVSHGVQPLGDQMK